MEDNLEFKAMSGQLTVDEAQGIVECFVAAIGNKDSVGDVVVSGAFEGSLKRRKPRVVWGHDWNQPIGKVLDIREVSASDPRLPAKMKQANVGGLYARVQFNLKSERGREAFNSITFFGEDQEWSIGYKTLDSIYSPERQANLLKEVELYEVSPVLHGANQLTATISVKSLDMSSMDEEDITSFRKSKWETFDFAWAKKLREEHPEIWKMGGNIKGNDQWEILSTILDNNGSAETQDQVNALNLREAWIARHEGDFRVPGVVAQIKWLAVGKQGESAMKKVINDEIQRRGDQMKGKAENACPIATQDIAVNIKNRQNAIDTAKYGPLNPNEPNKKFWTVKADRWDVTPEEAKKQRCGNCAAFIRTTDMMNCIEKALGNEEANDAIDVINAGELGYCEAFDFKCASARTCDAWIVGGPITDKNKKEETKSDMPTPSVSIDDSSFLLSLAKDLAAEIGMSVRLTSIEDGTVYFMAKDPEDGNIEKMKADFTFDGAEFSFSKPEEASDSEDGENPEEANSGEEDQTPQNQETWSGESPERKKPVAEYSGEDDVEEVYADAVKLKNESRLAAALETEMGSPISMRTVTRNTAIFDVMNEKDSPQTMRSSWHAQDGEIMIGSAEPVKVETVYTPISSSGEGQSYEGDEEMKSDSEDMNVKAPNAAQLQSLTNVTSSATSRVPTGSNLIPDTLPQERVTGDVLRGYGPRRGNLERLLRYWRPIMRKEGGFRRCRVILADHPELYPLNNICAWLHHETTGLWPNEGCHHPGMKNCRRKLKNVVRGSIISDSEFDNRLNKLRGGRGKSVVSEELEVKCGGGCGGMCGVPMTEDAPDMGDWMTVPGPGAGMAAAAEDDASDYTEEDVLHAIMVFRSFMENESDFVDFLRNEDNWMHEGHDGDGEWKSYEPEAGWSMKEAGCGCDEGKADDVEPSTKAYPMVMVMGTDNEDENPLATELKVLLANTYTFHFRAKGYNWNVTGQDFNQYYELFGSIADDAFDAIDPTAENVRKLGVYAPYKIADIARMRTIPDSIVSNDPMSLSKDLFAANEVMLSSLQDTFDLANRMNEQGVANFIAGRIEMQQKWRWQLKSSISNSGQIKADIGMVDMPEDGMMMDQEGSDSLLVTALKTVLADTVTFYLKSHGYHWNVETQDFSEYHALFLKIYEDTFEAINPAAENLRKLDAFAPYRFADFAEMRTLKDTNVSTEPQIMANDLASANDMVLESLNKAFAAANEDNQQGIANFIAERIDSHQKWRWQLKSSTEAAQLLKSVDLDEMMVKAGRVLNNRNLDRLRQAVTMIQEVLTAAGDEIQMKGDDLLVEAPVEDLFAIRQKMSEVVDYYDIDVEVTEHGVLVKGYDDLSNSARFDLSELILEMDNIEVKALTSFESPNLTD